MGPQYLEILFQYGPGALLSVLQRSDSVNPFQCRVSHGGTIKIEAQQNTP